MAKVLLTENNIQRVDELESQSRNPRKKKKKSGRSLMLSEIMPMLSGELGEKIQAAVEKQDGDKVQALMFQVGKKLKEKFSKK